MKFKKAEYWNELKQCGVWLETLANDVDDFCLRNFGKELVITRVLERVEGESGVHQEHRAFDARSQTADGEYFTAKEIEDILTYVNDKYKRCDGYRTVIHHSFNGGPKHLHFQLSALMQNYIRRPE